MPSYSKLASIVLPQDRSNLLRRCYKELPHRLEFRFFSKKPSPDDLYKRLASLEYKHSVRAMQVVVHSIQQAWEKFHQESVTPHEFLRARSDAVYKIVSIPLKGRGIVASRCIKAGEVVLKESPIVMMPAEPKSVTLLVSLPPKALEAILHLHNQGNDIHRYMIDGDSSHERLLNILSGIWTTNIFGVESWFGRFDVLLLTGSLFNHSDNPNMVESWDDTTEEVLFTTLRDIKEGEEMEIDYAAGLAGQPRAEKLKIYGIS